MRASRSKRMLVASVAAIACYSTAAAAQEHPVGDSPSAKSGSADRRPGPGDRADEGAGIVVTGSRIRRNDYEVPNPLTPIGSETLTAAGSTNLTDVLRWYPALSGSTGSVDAAGNNASVGETGLNLLNLRNRGADRTLVLVNGRRHIGGVPGSAAVTSTPSLSTSWSAWRSSLAALPRSMGQTA